MNNLLKKLSIYLVRKTFLGRGFFRKHSISFLKKQFLLKSTTKYDDLPSLVVDINNVPFKFYFDEKSNLSKFVGKEDKDEIDFLKSALPDNFIFLDIGANNGFYTQMLLAECKKNKLGRIVSIEPNPLMRERLIENTKLLDSQDFESGKYIDIVDCAVGESDTTAFLNFSLGYGQAYIEKSHENGIPVKIRPLIEILKSLDITKVDALKIDVEGFEYSALKPFFDSADESLFPRKIVIEYTHNDQWGNNDFIDILESEYSYKNISRTDNNILLQHT